MDVDVLQAKCIQTKGEGQRGGALPGLAGSGIRGRRRSEGVDKGLPTGEGTVGLTAYRHVHAIDFQTPDHEPGPQE